MSGAGHTTTGIAGDAVQGGPAAAPRRAALFERVMGRIYRYFRRVCWDASEAEDLAQETLLLLDRSIHERTYDPARSFNAWMWLKAHTVFAQWCRKRGRRMEPLADLDEPAARDDALGAAGERLDAERVLREVERRLGAEAYEQFLLYYQGGLTHQEIAEVSGRNRKTVAARIAEAHRLIDRLLR